MEPPIHKYALIKPSLVLVCTLFLIIIASVTASPVIRDPLNTLPSSHVDVIARSVTNINSESDSDRIEDEPLKSNYYFNFVFCAVLVVVGGLLAGLTLGLMSLDETNLRILATSGSETQRKYARRIQPIRKNGHWLLVTLLLGNTVVNETLPIVMDSIFGGGGVSAVLVSTALIVLFGEIIPQAVCARFGLAIGAFFAYPVRVIQYLLAPLGYPIAMLLDYVLGANHGITYKKAELKELVSLSDTAHGGNLSTDEVTIIRGALELSEKLVVDVMTDLSNVYMVDINSRLNRKLLSEMLRRGHSRVPVYDGRRTNIVGVLLVKSLILLDPDDCIPVREAKITPVPLVTPDVSLYDILNSFQEGGSHMAMVMAPPQLPPSPQQTLDYPSPVLSTSKTLLLEARTNNIPRFGSTETTNQIFSNEVAYPSHPRENYIFGAAAECKPKQQQSEPSDEVLQTYIPVGIITLEDVIEELIQEEIIDETDVFVDMRKRVKVVRAVKHQQQIPSCIRDSSTPLSLNPRSGEFGHHQKRRNVTTANVEQFYVVNPRRGLAFSSRRRQETKYDLIHGLSQTSPNIRPQSFPASLTSDLEEVASAAQAIITPQRSVVNSHDDDSDSRSV